MATKNAVLQMIIEQVLTDLMVKTEASNVIVNVATGETLTTRLASIATQATNFTTTSAMEAYVGQRLSDLINGAPETADTLKELSDLIDANKDVIATLNDAIGKKVDKVDGKGLSANDFTTALLNKLNNIAAGATKVESSTTNGNIKINSAEVAVYRHPGGNGNEHLPAGGSVGQVLRAAGEGAGEWGLAVRSGASAPENLLPNELFVKIL